MTGPKKKMNDCQVDITPSSSKKKAADGATVSPDVNNSDTSDVYPCPVSGCTIQFSTTEAMKEHLGSCNGKVHKKYCRSNSIQNARIQNIKRSAPKTKSHDENGAKRIKVENNKAPVVIHETKVDDKGREEKERKFLELLGTKHLKDGFLFPGVKKSNPELWHKLMRARNGEYKNQAIKCLECGSRDFGEGAWCLCDCGVVLCQDCYMMEGSDLVDWCQTCEKHNCNACSFDCSELCDEFFCLNCSDCHDSDCKGYDKMIQHFKAVESVGLSKKSGSETTDKEAVPVAAECKLEKDN